VVLEKRRMLQELKSNSERGIPLNDEDRMPWLRRLHDELERRLGSGASVVLAEWGKPSR
jgi:gluconate kinase